MTFCSQCGSNLSEAGTCPKCNPGTVQQAPPPPQPAQQAPPPPQPAYQPPPPPPQPAYQAPPPPQPAYQAPPPPPQPQYQPPPAQYPPSGYPAYAPQPKPHYAPGGYAERLHSFGKSTLFMIGIILFSAGAVLAEFMSFSAASIITLGLLALPITGFWLIFAASKAPGLPEKTLTSLTLFKVAIIISLVLYSIVALLLLIAAISLFAAASALAGNPWAQGGVGGLAFAGFVLLLASGGIVAFMIIYFKAVLKTLAGIKNNLLYNTFYPLEGIKMFTILTYIGVGFTALLALISLFSLNVIGGMIWDLPGFMRDIVWAALPSQGIAAFNALFTLTHCAGIVICVKVLNDFNDSLQPNPYATTQQPYQAPPPPPAPPQM